VQSLIERLRAQDTNTLGVIVKADKQGSLEAIEGALERFNEEGEHVKVIHSGTGDVSDSDIKVAAATRAIVIGFNVKVNNVASKMAETEHVLIRTYTIIYELLDELEDVIEGMLKVRQLEEIFGTAQIVAEFPYGKNERIAGCKVLDGHISKGPRVRVVRGEEILWEGKIKSLKKVRDEVSKVEKGDECGIMLEDSSLFQPGDLIQSFRLL
jgi:translation initiation factor IF-2